MANERIRRSQRGTLSGNLIIRDFHLTDHAGFIRFWLSSRNLSHTWSDDLPESGFISFQGDDAIAAGFLRKIGIYNGMMEGFITNPKADADLRDLSLDLLAKACIKKAKQLHLKQIMAYSVDERTLLRSQKFGFEKLPHTLIIKAL